MQEIEMKTAAGYRLRIEPKKNLCQVFQDSGAPLELERSSVDGVEVPSVLFLGKRFRMVLKSGEYVLVKNVRQKARVPYRQANDEKIRYLNVSSFSPSDEFPVWTQCYESVREFTSANAVERFSFRYMLLESDIPRIDMMTLRMKNPGAQMLILQEGSEIEAVVQAERVTDVIAAGEVSENAGEGEKGKNAVFLARLYLRRLELARVQNLIFDVKMSVEEMAFIRKFLQIMIGNADKGGDLVRALKELEKLNEIYRLSSLLVGDQKEEFDEELDKGVASETAKDMASIVAHYRGECTEKSEEIRYWEWEYRLKKMANGS